MSTCPEKDIHSIYLDGELPVTYIEKYEAHLATCESCRKQLDSLKMLRAIFNADKKDLELSQKDMDDSFARLQARMSFAKHTNRTNVVKFQPRTWVSVVAGAAAALALVFIPVRLSANKGMPLPGLSTFKPVANVDLVSPTTAAFQPVDGELSSSSIANLFSGGETFVGNSEILNTFSSNLSSVPYSPAQQVSYNQNGVNQTIDAAAQLASYDIFTPVPRRSRKDFSDSNSNVSRVEFSIGNISFDIHIQGE